MTLSKSQNLQQLLLPYPLPCLSSGILRWTEAGPWFVASLRPLDHGYPFKHRGPSTMIYKGRNIGIVWCYQVETVRKQTDCSIWNTHKEKFWRNENFCWILDTKHWIIFSEKCYQVLYATEHYEVLNYVGSNAKKHKVLLQNKRD